MYLSFEPKSRGFFIFHLKEDRPSYLEQGQLLSSIPLQISMSSLLKENWSISSSQSTQGPDWWVYVLQSTKCATVEDQKLFWRVVQLSWASQVVQW